MHSARNPKNRKTITFVHFRFPPTILQWSPSFSEYLWLSQILMKHLASTVATWSIFFFRKIVLPLERKLNYATMSLLRSLLSSTRSVHQSARKKSLCYCKKKIIWTIKTFRPTNRCNRIKRSLTTWALYANVKSSMIKSTLWSPSRKAAQ